MRKPTETSPELAPQLNEEDLFNIDPVQMASKITFIADDTIQVVSNLHWSEV